MKFDSLRVPKRTTKQPTKAERRAQFVREQKSAFPDAISKLGLSDADIAQIHCVNARDQIADGFVETEPRWERMATMSRFAVPCAVQGWSVVPQDAKGERRPSFVTVPGKSTMYNERRGGTIFRPTEYREKLASLATMVGIAYGTGGSNLAIQCCAASAHVRVLDIDCKDAEVAERVKQLAIDVLGPTPFVRYGARPKVALIYRQEPGTGDDRWSIPRWAVELLGEDGRRELDDDGKPINAVEFLSEGGLLTAYGLHHRTGQSFDWSEGRAHPAIASPLEAPVIDKASIRLFLNRMRDIRQLSGGVSTSNPYGGSGIDVDELRKRAGGRVWTPELKRGPFVIDAEGHITDGAEVWLSQMAWAMCAANAHDLKRFYGLIEDILVTEAEGKLGKTHRDNESLSGLERIAKSAREKLRAAATKWYASLEEHARSGKYHDICVPWTVTDDGRRPQSKRVMPAPRPAHGSLDWIPDDYCIVDGLSDHAARAKVLPVKKAAALVEADRHSRRIIEDPLERRKIGEEVTQKVDTAIHRFLGTIGDTSIELPSVHLLKAPPGAGKTSHVVRSLTAWCAENRRGDGEGPIFVSVPTHANADETLAKADAEGMITPSQYWSERDMKDAVKELRKKGVKAIPFRGREAAGCQQRDKMRLLNDAGLRGSGLCKKKMDVDDPVTARMKRREGEKIEQEEVLCEFLARGECKYFAQFSDLKDADVVLISHAYLTMHGLPAELKKCNPRALIIDETIVYQVLQIGTMTLESFQTGGVEPFVTKQDKKKWPDLSNEDIAAMYFSDQEEAIAVATDALKDGKDVAEVMREHKRGAELVDAAILVLSRSKTLQQDVNPRLDIEKVRELAATPVNRDMMTKEKFWRLIKDRMTGVEEGSAKGERDERVRLIMLPKPGGHVIELTIIMGWRKELNWNALPTLLLDASGVPEIIGKIYGRAVEVTNIEAPAHVRTVAAIESTYANSRFIPRFDADDKAILQSEQLIQQARALITTTAMVYAYGRVLVGMTKAVREAIQSGWEKPKNVDFGHFGAFRGLDFAKGHVAALSIGRSEQPVHVLDAYRAALTYDDETPEQPFDKLGTGHDAEGNPVMRKPQERRLRMRTGEDISHWVPEMPKIKDSINWARLLEEQWREEELRQFLGRLRPVYRGIAKDADGNPIDVETPVWICMSKCVPQDVVIDEVVTLDQMLQAYPVAELVRLSDGILSETVTPHAPGAENLLAGRSLQQFIKDMLPHNDKWSRRLMDGMGRIHYTPLGSTDKKMALVATGWIDGDPVAAFEHNSERWGAALPEVADYKPSKRQPVIKSGPRDPDKLDLRLAAGETDVLPEPDNSALSAASMIAQIPTGLETREPSQFSILSSSSTSTRSKAKSMRFKPPLSRLPFEYA